jgi:hypothetical protein
MKHIIVAVTFLLLTFSASLYSQNVLIEQKYGSRDGDVELSHNSITLNINGDPQDHVSGTYEYESFSKSGMPFIMYNGQENLILQSDDLLYLFYEDREIDIGINYTTVGLKYAGVGLQGNRNAEYFSKILPAKTYQASSFFTERAGTSSEKRYEASNLSYINLDNPWVEGVSGSGIGEYIDLEWEDDVSALFIVNGFVSYEKPELYQKNNRAKTIKITYSGGNYEIIHTLEDTPNPQTINLGTGTDDVRIEIIDVYRGTQWDDTCISMVQGLDSDDHEVFFAETFKEMIAPYCGYYIHVNWDYVNRRPNENSTNILQDVEIVELSLEDDLIYEKLSYVNGEIVAENKIALTYASQYSPDDVRFQRDYNRRPSVGYNAQYFDPPRVGIDSGRGFVINSNIDTFVTEAADVPAAIQSVFSAEAQSKYAGNFVFDHYEIINLENTENPLDNAELQQNAINVTLHENGYLYAEANFAGTSSLETPILQERFYITDKKTHITGGAGDGGFRGWSYSYNYEDENTIAYNWDLSQGSDSDDYDGYAIHYKIVYKKKH